jgi:hypothetical protein
MLAPFLALGVGPVSITASFSPAARLGGAVVSVGIAVGAALFGEALRRGYRPVWIMQIIGTASLTLLGLFQIPAAIQSVQAGHAGTAVSTFVLAILCPYIAWRLAQPSTRAWFAQTTSAQARAQHGGRWLVFIVIYSIISGALIAFAPLY